MDGNKEGREDCKTGGLRHAVIRVRNDLRFTPQAVDSRPHYLVEDPVRSKFYRIGFSEYVFISLLDGETTVYYDFAYTGSAPVVLERIIPRIQVYSDQVPVADVTGGLVVTESGEIELEEGYLPVGESLTLQPGDTFQAGFTYLGKEIGWNKILGFRLQYSLEGRLNDVELELTEKYYVFVE